MSNRPALITQATLARALRAIKQVDVPARVEIKPDGVISIFVAEPDRAKQAAVDLAKRIVL